MGPEIGLVSSHPLSVSSINHISICRITQLQTASMNEFKCSVRVFLDVFYKNVQEGYLQGRRSRIFVYNFQLLLLNFLLLHILQAL